MIPNYTTIVGVDARHLRQLAVTWPTWRKNKPSLLAHPLIVFYDWRQVKACDVVAVVDHPSMRLCMWPPTGVTFSGDDKTKWTNPQRHKMLAGFVHAPAHFVETEYFLKLDTDAIATGMDDWIDPSWFVNNSAIVCHPWGFTRPPELMVWLDQWVADNADTLPQFMGTKPLDLLPKPGWDRVRHPRIISWCAFFKSDFNRTCAQMAEATTGYCQLPVASQDSYLFYVALRLGLPIVRPRMKSRGWSIFSTDHNVRKCAELALQN